MRIAFIHYHLRPGGVTRVISEQVDALKDYAETVVVTGEPPETIIGSDVIVIPPLAYDRDRKDNIKPGEIAHAIIQELNAKWKGGPDLIHFHNPTLRKNKGLVEIIKIMISKGLKVLLQIHDFAEDGRPGNYSDEEYPSDCHYAVINRKDYNYLLKSGLGRDGLHLLPNSIKPLVINPEYKRERDIILYPIRAIRRKNIGEAILLSLFFRNHESLGITLEPTSKLDIKSYKGWVNFVSSEGLGVWFRLGIENCFEDILARTRCMITTSIKEGFGFSFLEPWTIERMLFGRLIEDVCSDFIENGIILDHLYKKVRIPLNFIDEDLFYKRWKECLLDKIDLYKYNIDQPYVENAFSNIISDGSIDFGLLNENLQKKVILKILKAEKNYEKLLDLNPFLLDINYLKNTSEIIDNNKKIVLEEYSSEKYRANLLKMYKEVLYKDVRQSINKRILLKQFINPQTNYLLLCDLSYE